MNNTLTDTFIKNLMDYTDSHLDDSIYNHVKNCFLDYIGCAVSGARLLGAKSEKLLNSPLCSDGESCIFGKGKHYGVNIASLVNGMYSHALEMDDGQRVGTLHLAAPVFSGLLAVAENENITYGDFLRGAIAGYETAIRLACSVQPYHKKRGFHTTGTCGTIGTAMAIATSLKFDFEQFKTTLAASVSSAAGVLEMLSDDSELKPFNVGRAASDGITAAYVGKAGFVAPDDALMGKRGFYATMTEKYDLSYITTFEEHPDLCKTTFFKPYAACRHCHPAIEAAIMLAKDNVINPDEILEIIVKTYDLAIVGHDHKEAKSVNAAKMGIPYSVAVSIIDKKADILEFSEECLERKDIADLSSKVTVYEDPSLSALIPDKRAAIVEIVTSNKVYRQRVDVAKGEPENPMTREELVQKFNFLARYAGKDAVWCSNAVKAVYESGYDEKVNDLISYMKIS
jgi:2-methylcitrate dehydratase PrpD